MDRHYTNPISALRMKHELECVNALYELDDNGMTGESYEEVCKKLDVFFVLCACETLSSNARISDKKRLKVTTAAKRLVRE